MGKYIRNGEVMWGTSDKSENISYGNGTVKTALDDLNGQLNTTTNKLSAISDYVVNETIIGKIGDDTLYRRCYMADSVSISNAETLIDANFKSSDIKMLLKVELTEMNRYGEWNTNFGAYADKSYYALAKVDNGGVKINLNNVTVIKYIITIEYTKA